MISYYYQFMGFILKILVNLKFLKYLWKETLYKIYFFQLFFVKNHHYFKKFYFLYLFDEYLILKLNFIIIIDCSQNVK